MLAKILIACAALSTTSAALALTVDCPQGLTTFTKTQLPKKDYARYELDSTAKCRWVEAESEATPSVLFRAPRSSSATEIEIATYLDHRGTTATHVALLNVRYEPVKWIPFSAFRERKGSLVARFFINPDSNVNYILVGGAAEASETALARTYYPLSSNILNVAGLVTARERQTEFKFIPTGKIRVRIRKTKTTKVDITH